MPLHVSSTCAHYQEVRIVLHSLWYHHTETSEWSKITKIHFININAHTHTHTYLFINMNTYIFIYL